MTLRTLPLPPERHRSRFRLRFLRKLYHRVFRKSVWQGCLLVLFCYFLIYAFLSASGDWYQNGERIEWSPYGLRFDLRKNDHGRVVARGSFFGYVFGPLIVADRFTLHRSMAADSAEAKLVKVRKSEQSEYERQINFE